jgi:hypothetical protein
MNLFIIFLILSLIDVIIIIFVFIKYLKVLKKYNLFKKIKLFKINEIVLGIVRVSGTAKVIKLIKTPFSKTNCVFYRYVEAKFNVHKKYGHSEIIKDVVSKQNFMIEDDTGKLEINPIKIFPGLDLENFLYNLMMMVTIKITLIKKHLKILKK